FGHVLGDLFQHAFLRGGRMKRQDALYGIADAVVDLEGDTGLSARLAALEFESEFEKEKFLEDEPDVRRRARRLQVSEALADFRPVRLPESAPAIDQPHAPADRTGYRVGKILGEVLEHAVNYAAEPARGEAAIPGTFVDGNDATNFKRMPLLFLSTAIAVRRRGIVQDFELRLDDFEAVASAITRFNFAIKRHQHSGTKFVLQVRGVEPYALQRVTALANRHLEDGHSARAEQSTGAYLCDDAGHLTRAQFADTARVQAVFVTERQVVEQILDRCDALLQQNLGEPR